jgi:predicted nucleic acid-binding protein
MGDPEQVAAVLEQSALLDLTYYEVGNALWKEVNLLKTIPEREGETLAEGVERVLRATPAITPSFEEFKTILHLAWAERLTFYDAAYVAVAKSTKRKLVTEDERLSKVASKYVEVLHVAGLGKS